MTMMAVIGILKGIGGPVLEIPMIHRWIENAVAKTPTRWDNILWAGIEYILSVDSTRSDQATAAIVANVTSATQQAYDEHKALVKEGVQDGAAFDIAVSNLPWMDATMADKALAGEL